MTRVKVIPGPGIFDTRVLVVSESGEESDISHLVMDVSWRHRAGEVPICSLQLFAQEDSGFTGEAMTALGEFVSVVIGPGPVADGAADVTSLIDRVGNKVSA